MHIQIKWSFKCFVIFYFLLPICRVLFLNCRVHLRLYEEELSNVHFLFLDTSFFDIRHSILATLSKPSLVVFYLTDFVIWIKNQFSFILFVKRVLVNACSAVLNWRFRIINRFINSRLFCRFE